MKALGLLFLGVVMVAPAVFGSSGAEAQQRVGGGPRIAPPPPGHSNHFSWERGHRRFRGGFFPVFLVEREVVRVVEVEVPVAAPPPVVPPPPPPPRKPYVIGKSYNDLPEGCMKLIEDGTSYYHCDGEWYRQVGRGRYVAVAARL